MLLEPVDGLYTKEIPLEFNLAVGATVSLRSRVDAGASGKAQRTGREFATKCRVGEANRSGRLSPVYLWLLSGGRVANEIEDAALRRAGELYREWPDPPELFSGWSHLSLSSEALASERSLGVSPP